MTKETRKFIIYGLCIITWIGFWTYMGQSSESENSEQTAQTSTTKKSPQEIALERCQEVRAEGERLDKINSDFVTEAKKLQRVWIIDEMTALRDSGKITAAEWKSFSDYMFKPLSESNMPLLEVIDLMDKVVKFGYIKLYLPSNVVEVGSKAASGESSSDYYVDYPECFSDFDNDMHKLISELPQVKGTWERKLDSPMELLP